MALSVGRHAPSGIDEGRGRSADAGITESREACFNPNKRIFGAQASARDRIMVYDQYGDGWASWPLNDGETGGNNMENSGCLIFAYAHAIQWLTGQKASRADRAALIKELICVCDFPWGPRAYNPTDAQALYSAHIMRRYGAVEIPVPRSAPAMEELFGRGGVMIANPGGHYIAAVGAAYGDSGGGTGDEYCIHVVDSSCQSTWWRTNQNYGSPLYEFDSRGIIQGYRKEGDSFVDGTVNGTVMSKWAGGEYWVPLNAFGRYRLDRAYLPGGSDL